MRRGNTWILARDSVYTKNLNELFIMRPLVAINCLVYNHEPYLRDCLEGFVMQQTDFPFVAIVHDDASTDHSADIIREYAAKYPDIIRPIYETENQYSKSDGSLGRVMNTAIDATGAKYVAMCEGDDYWTDPLKLQKQVDFLEEHSDYSMVTTAYTMSYQQDPPSEIWRLNRVSTTIKAVDLVRANCIGTLTVCYRIQCSYGYQPLKGIRMGDYPFWIYLAEHGRVHYIDDITANYRILTNSASCRNSDLSRSLFLIDVLKVKFNYINKPDYECLVPEFQKEIKGMLEHCFNACLVGITHEALSPLVMSYSYSWQSKVRLWGLKNKIYYSIAQHILRIYSILNIYLWMIKKYQ